MKRLRLPGGTAAVMYVRTGYAAVFLLLTDVKMTAEG